MPTDSKQYKTATSFRRALEDRLKHIAEKEAIPLDRMRRRVSFDRLLARLFDRNKPPLWLLKGGYALEFRYQNMARSTTDIDFSIPKMKEPTKDKIQGLLQDEVKKDIGDWFVFLIGAPIKDLDQTIYGGWRYPVETRLDNRQFSKFHLDVGVGDAVVSEPEWQKGLELFSFAGIEPVFAALLPKDQQFAEKVHSYTFPREIREFSRTKDLVDMVLLIDQGLPEKPQMVKAIQATFERRATHSLPNTLLPPPTIVATSYNAMAIDCGVSKKTVDEAFQYINGYWQQLFY
ncbi:MAG: nucleotidyl transferase AbiEii/AbiGii toxin family protein [Planctomycetes bacterium]|nr:nucleotidyl transferase AbiEii/AbiGii toxin family protein [Planctomycetota bacterium]